MLHERVLRQWSLPLHSVSLSVRYAHAYNTPSDLRKHAQHLRLHRAKLDSEYPEVNGRVSVVTYIAALDAAYERFKERHTKASKLAATASALISDGADIAPSHSFSLAGVD